MTVRGLLNRVRLAPRAELRALLSPREFGEDDRADVESLAAFCRPAGPQAPAAGDRTLLLLNLPLHYVIKFAGFVGLAMRRRGYRVIALTDGFSDALARPFHERGFGFECVRLEDFLTYRNAGEIRARADELLHGAAVDVAGLKAFRYRGALTGQHALATLSSTIPHGRLVLDEPSRRPLRRLLRRSMLLTDAAEALVHGLRPTLAFGVEKGFVGTAELFYAALQSGVDYVQWVGCHEPESVMLKRFGWQNFRDHPFSISPESWEAIRARPWDDALREQVLGEFASGYKGGSWFNYKRLAADQRQAERSELGARLGLDPAKKTAIIYSHILNDANLFYGEDLFGRGYEEWLVETVRAARDNPAVNWVLKLHPANKFRNANLGYRGEYGEILALREAFGAIPASLKIVYPEEQVSPLSFFRITDYGITVRGTVGIELPCFGIPVLTAGTGRYSGKGFTVDARTREEYLARIARIQDVPALTEAQIRDGIRYAYYVFRARPARYGEIFADAYNHPAGHPRHRDLALRQASLAAVLDHPQMRRITDFLATRDLEDFLELPVEGGARA